MCITSRLFHIFPPDCPLRGPSQTQPCQAANRQNLSIMGTYDMEFQIGAMLIMHPVQVIQNLHEEAILRIAFINKHKMTYDPKWQSFSWDTLPSRCSRHPSILKETNIRQCSITTVKVNLTTRRLYSMGKDQLLIHIARPNLPYLIDVPYWIQPNCQGQAHPQLHSV